MTDTDGKRGLAVSEERCDIFLKNVILQDAVEEGTERKRTRKRASGWVSTLCCVFVAIFLNI